MNVDAKKIETRGGLANCRANRRNNRLICRDCPFRQAIEGVESKMQADRIIKSIVDAVKAGDEE